MRLGIRPENGISISCGPRGGHDIAEAIERAIQELGAPVDVMTIKCLGLCQ